MGVANRRITAPSDDPVGLSNPISQEDVALARIPMDEKETYVHRMGLEYFVRKFLDDSVSVSSQGNPHGRHKVVGEVRLGPEDGRGDETLTAMLKEGAMVLPEAAVQTLAYKLREYVAIRVKNTARRKLKNSSGV